MRGMSILRGLFVLLILLLSGDRALKAADPTAHRALERTLPSLNFAGVALNDAIDFLRDVSGANIHVDWRALETAGVGKDTVVNVRLRSVSMRKVLSLLLNEAGGGSLLTYYASEGVIEITTREVADRQMFTRVYPIQDLIMDVPDFVGPDFNIAQANTGGGRGGGGGGGQSIFGGSGASTSKDEHNMTKEERAQQLIEVITSTIQPDIWAANGGTAAVRFFNGNLIVTAPRSVHEALGGVVD